MTTTPVSHTSSPRSEHELARLHFEPGQIVVLYKTGTALVHGKGSHADHAAVCRAADWKCKQ